jgi:hypothetical protein
MGKLFHRYSFALRPDPDISPTSYLSAQDDYPAAKLEEIKL